MMRDLKIKSFPGLLIAVFLFLGLNSSATAQAHKVKAAFTSEPAAQQPLYSEYKGVRLGMTAQEVRAKLGKPELAGNDQDYYVFSENETAQIGYDAAGTVVTISVDYLGGIGAPDYKTVVGGELETTSDGSLYRLVRYQSLGFWVCYNRSTGPVATVSLTIQKFPGTYRIAK
jgi:outer membrane protein assembly factor BamE (lipoprotein component of BamABCDE complex)